MGNIHSSDLSILCLFLVSGGWVLSLFVCLGRSSSPILLCRVFALDDISRVALWPNLGKQRLRKRRLVFSIIIPRSPENRHG